MSEYLDVIKKEVQPKISSLLDDMRNRRDPTFFWPTGTQVYCGRQGSGKTISAVKHVHDLKEKYPAAIVVSNLDLKYFKARKYKTKKELAEILQNFDPQSEYIFFENMGQLGAALTGVNNGFQGVIYLIDEIHTYFNALDSKNIPVFVFTEISQQRKQRKVIIGTSQLFLRMAKPFREQCDNMVKCRTFFGVLTFTKAFDGMELDQDYNGNLIGKPKKRGWFFHTRKIRGMFDTYQKIVSGQEQYGISQEVSIDLKSKKNKINLTKR